jgi:hypothetical protein
MLYTNRMKWNQIRGPAQLVRALGLEGAGHEFDSHLPPLFLLVPLPYFAACLERAFNHFAWDLEQIDGWLRWLKFMVCEARVVGESHDLHIFQIFNLKITHSVPEV